MWLLDKFLRRLVQTGPLVIIEAKGTRHEYGVPDPKRRPVVVRFLDASAPNAIARNPRLGLGEAYMEGRFVIEEGDIRALLDLARANRPWERGGGTRAKGLVRRGAAQLVGGLDRLNWQRRSRRNVAHHYDLSDRLYDLFLDSDRQYSCAYFNDPANGLEQAQADKKAHIAAKLYLSPGQRVLDIGCGWGGTALYLNRVADVDVLGITLSEEQLKVARTRAAEAGVAERVKFELIDYRQVEGRFDRIVSIGMFEHVGPRHYRTFFRKCRSLLTPEGVMLLHTIGRLGKPGVTDPWTAKYIFPGGYNPALSEIVEASQSVKLIAADVETLRLHYAHTLDLWYDRAVAARTEIETLYDARFYRMWLFYLAGASSAFRYGGLCNYQIQYIRDRSVLPITRDYLQSEEARLRSLSAP
ncbi:cyclopropane-fatty-acyl-phospholipid synthase [Rhodoligotrophos appendicifer]|uniref:SAM-dependent methyltransferase n=1 Tax=Rhodoligotrophos appendicifer TaxID=987056 RepID=UPI00118591D7|nr:cyclopropane-fatty-acyl-phospholipid synthase family protein [Rhodoligotrophos appendicifer]